METYLKQVKKIMGDEELSRENLARKLLYFYNEMNRLHNVIIEKHERIKFLEIHLKRGPQ